MLHLEGRLQLMKANPRRKLRLHREGSPRKRSKARALRARCSLKDKLLPSQDRVAIRRGKIFSKGRIRPPLSQVRAPCSHSRAELLQDSRPFSSRCNRKAFSSNLECSLSVDSSLNQMRHSKKPCSRLRLSL